MIRNVTAAQEKSAQVARYKPLRMREVRGSHLWRLLSEIGAIKDGNSADPRRSGHPCQMTSMFPPRGAYFPSAMWSRVHRAMVRDRANNVSYSWSEHSHGTVRPFVEVDMIGPGVDLSDEGVIKYAKAVHKGFSRFFSGGTDCVVMVAKPKTKMHGESGAMRLMRYRGIHVVFTNKVVDIQSLGQMIHSLREVTLPAEGLDASFVDDGPVKTTSGYAHLRVPYAVKPVDCPECENEPMAMEDCSYCIHRGKVFDGNPYVPIGMIDADGTWAPGAVQDPMIGFIVPPGGETASDDYKVPETDPVHYDLSVAKTVRMNGKMVRVPGVSRMERAVPGSWKPLPEDVATESMRILSTFVRDMNPEWYSELRIGTPVCPENKSVLRFKVFGSGRNMCAHRNNGEGGQHKSNGIYFLVEKNKNHVRQMCYDPDCKQYIKEHPNAGTWPMATDMKDIVFGIKPPVAPAMFVDVEVAAKLKDPASVIGKKRASALMPNGRASKKARNAAVARASAAENMRRKLEAMFVD